MLVCHCHAVNDREIRREIIAGALDAEDVAERCGAGTRCGSCRPVVEALLAEAGVAVRARRPAAAA
jgi:bacterioferritin-associated ferredoxin